MSDPYDQTRRIEQPPPPGQRPIDETQVIDQGARPVGGRRPVEPEPELEPERERRWPQYLIAGLVGVLVGFAFAFVVVAMGTTGQETDQTELIAAQERIDALESELAERDARIAELESELAERDARIAELETRLAEAEAAAGERDADIEAQRRALDERSAAMDERARALDEREMALDRREREIADREAAPEQGEQPDDGPGLPQFDPEQAESIVERVLERIREVFGGGDD